MKLKQLLETLNSLAQQHGISQPYLCGGVPRDKLLGRIEHVNDLDLTTGDASVKQLAALTAQHFASFGSKLEQMSDGHSKVLLGKLQLDFSSHFVIPGIQPILQQKGIVKPTSLQMEMFSRDFTCNALLISLDLKSVLDATQQGIKSLKTKTLTTCLNSELTLGSDPKRIVRAIYLGAKLNFSLAPEMISWIRSHHEMGAQIDSGYATRKLNKAFQYNPKQAVKLMNQTNLWQMFPTLPVLERWRRYAK